MNIQYKKLLPKNLQSSRWGELIEAFQYVTTQIKDNKIKTIKYQYILDQMTDSEIIKMASTLGYKIPYFDGYCETTEYLKKQLLTIIPRILTRNSPGGYDYIAKIYNLIFEVYPMYLETHLIPILNWDTNPEINISSLNLDATPTLTLDSVDFETLDFGNLINKITRHIIVKYKHINVESTTEFMSSNMLRALYFDLQKHKRKTEVLYFEPCIVVNNDSTKGITEELYYTYDRLSSGTVRSFLKYKDLTLVKQIHLGNSSWGLTDLSTGTITDVKNLTYKLNFVSPSSGSNEFNVDIYNQTTNEVDVAKWVFQKQRLRELTSGELSSGDLIEYFSEVALLDENSNLVGYAEFPQVRMMYEQKQLYNNIAVKISLV